jgi:hypothetical protein
MLPVSGAEQLQASGVRNERPIISHKIPYSSVERYIDGTILRTTDGWSDLRRVSGIGLWTVRNKFHSPKL